MNGIQQWGGYSGQQLAPQGLLGGLLGASLGGADADSVADLEIQLGPIRAGKMPEA
jgi:hypothetical protein